MLARTSLLSSGRVAVVPAVALALALASTTAPANAAPVTNAPVSVTLPEGVPGSLSFGVGEPGTVTVRVQTEANVIVSVRGANDVEKGAARGAGVLVVTVPATLQDLAAGKLWSVVITETVKKRSTALVTVTAPSGMFTVAEAAGLPEIVQAPKLVARKLAPPAAEPTANEIAKATALATERVGIKANVAAIGQAPIRVTPNVTPPPTTPPPSTPQHRWAGFQSVVVTGRGTTQVCNGVVQCRVSGGDTITMLSDGANGGFAGIAPEVHFYYLAGGAVTQTDDIAVTPIANGVGGFVIQVPMRPGSPVQEGMIVLGNPTGAVTSAPWGFHYSPRFVTDYVIFDRSLYPAGQKLWETQKQSSLFTGGLEFSTVGAPMPDKKIAVVSYMSAAMFSADSFDLILPGLVLKNGWTVSDVVFVSSSMGRSGGYGYVADKHIGTNNAEVKVKWGIGGNPSSTRYELQVAITGEEGTQYY
jgi:hypothetical protein